MCLSDDELLFIIDMKWIAIEREQRLANKGFDGLLKGLTGISMSMKEMATLWEAPEFSPDLWPHTKLVDVQSTLNTWRKFRVMVEDLSPPIMAKEPKPLKPKEPFFRFATKRRWF